MERGEPNSKTPIEIVTTRKGNTMSIDAGRMEYFTRYAILALLALMTATLAGSCQKTIANPLDSPQPAIKNTVFVAKPATHGGWMSSPVGGSYTNQSPPRYRTNHTFGNEGIAVGYQYIGKGVAGENTAVCDVYIVSLKVGDSPTEYQAAYYEGGDKVLFDRPEINVSFTQEAENGSS